MRLGQLARKLALRPAEIVEFLAAHQIQIEEGSNTRLQDDHVIMVMEKFAPANAAEVVAELAQEKIQQNAIVEEVIVEDEVAVPEASEVLAITDHADKSEVIKAPKVELSGLKVLGKIELPELKKKETPGEPQPQEKISRPVVKKSQARTDRSQPRREKNPIALQREREAMDEERKRQEKLQADKEKRTKNYHKRVASNAPTKRAKMIDEPLVEMSTEDLKEKPKSLIGRFFRWLRT